MVPTCLRTEQGSCSLKNKNYYSNRPSAKRKRYNDVTVACSFHQVYRVTGGSLSVQIVARRQTHRLTPRLTGSESALPSETLGVTNVCQSVKRLLNRDELYSQRTRTGVNELFKRLVLGFSLYRSLVNG